MTRGVQLRTTAGALAARLLRSIEWSDEARDSVDEATESLVDAFEGEAAIAAIGKALKKRWSSLHDEQVDTKPRLSLVSRRFEEVVSKIAVIFEQGPDGHERGLDALSDGQQSLLYFALIAAVFDMERQVAKGKVGGFHTDQLRIPALSIFALEEPENHLSPFFLSRIVRQVRSLTEEGRAQAIVTSHSPAVLSRVRPVEVRYCRCDPKTRVASVKRIKLPRRATEEGKFVRGAMLAFPEVYFARFVLLVEGDSERVVAAAVGGGARSADRSGVRRYRPARGPPRPTFLAAAVAARYPLCDATRSRFGSSECGLRSDQNSNREI